MPSVKTDAKILIYIFIAYQLILTIFSNPGYPSQIYNNKFFPYLVDKPLTEDGFYMLTAARNFAEGRGISYNFNEPTTGVQPLSVFVYSAIFKLTGLFNCSDFLTLRLVLFFSLSLLFVFFFQVVSLIKELNPSLNQNLLKLSAALFVFFNMDLFIQFSNGLETGLYLILITICIRLSYKYDSQAEIKSKELLQFGVLFGLTSLARIDFLIVSLAIYIILFISNKMRIRQLILVAIPQAIIIIPWVLYIYLITGTFIQSSASAQSTMVNMEHLPERFYWLVKSLLQNITPSVLTTKYDFILILIVAIILSLLFTKRQLIKPVIQSQSSKFILLYWTVPFVVLFFSYLLFSYATYFYIRYTAPLQIVTLLFFTQFLSLYFEKLPIRRLLVIILFIAAFFLQTYFYFHSGKLGVHQNLRIKFVKENFSIEEKVGMYQSGVTGFFCGNVINLDGKINHSVITYRKKENLARYIDSVKIDGLIEWKGFETELPEEYLKKNWKLITNDIGDGLTVCYKRIE